ncbi:hypothetical protein [Nonomuraea turkmeniaca]|nr:hypothetical protein [Nonomuraea turkmeniaca]
MLTERPKGAQRHWVPFTLPACRYVRRQAGLAWVMAVRACHGAWAYA